MTDAEAMMEMLVSTEWLAARLGAAGLRILDASYHAFEPARDTAAEFAGGHIPGAALLYLGNLRDKANPLPTMLPPAEAFAAHVAALGVGEGDRVVLYDSSVHRTAARAWWMFRAFGFESVAVLDGGLPKWIAEGRALEQGEAAPLAGRVIVRKDEGAVRSLGQMLANLESGAEQVVDARGATRFSGAEGDPRGLADGHIPGSRNLPYDRLLNTDGTFRARGELARAFAEAGVDLSRPIVTTCGSGITASVVLFAARLLGASDVALYDGSWSEWGALPDTPKATGPALEPAA